MSDEPIGGPMHKCPFCEGRGELPEKELFDRLSEKDLARKLATYVRDVIVADEKSSEDSETVAAGKTEFQRHVDMWNCTHFLWRRSPKE
jgi:hypothetical protein